MSCKCKLYDVEEAYFASFAEEFPIAVGRIRVVHSSAT